MFDNTRYARRDLDLREIKLHVELEGCVIGASYFVELTSRRIQERTFLQSEEQGVYSRGGQNFVYSPTQTD